MRTTYFCHLDLPVNNQITTERFSVLKNNWISGGSLCIVEANMTPKINPDLMYLIIAAVAFVLINR